jgi:hypothetical protein
VLEFLSDGFFREALVDETLHGVFGISSALLDSPHQLVFAAFLEAEVIVGQLRVFLFEFSFRDIPITLDMKCVHSDAPSFFRLLIFKSALLIAEHGEHAWIRLKQEKGQSGFVGTSATVRR